MPEKKLKGGCSSNDACMHVDLGTLVNVQVCLPPRRLVNRHRLLNTEFNQLGDLTSLMDDEVVRVRDVLFRTSNQEPISL